MRKILYILSCYCALQSTWVSAWNAVGHRLVAQIAYDQMSPEARQFFKQENNLLNHKHKAYGLVNSAVWMDQLYAAQYKSLRSMHYIDLPFTSDQMKLPPYAKNNAVFAIEQADKVLSNFCSTDLDKAISVRILWHVVGDIHQPLHAATCISSVYPFGDRGGNLVILQKNSVARNLHAYWDKGAGFLNQKTHYRQQDIKKMAKKIQQQFPCHLQSMTLDPMSWAKESHEIAVKIAYGTLHNNADEKYQQTVQRISLERIAIAGCRLAALSDHIAMHYASKDITSCRALRDIS